MTASELVLEIAALPRNVALARLFASGAARDAGVDEATIDDLKIAVSEAVTSALRAAGEDDLITVRTTDTGDRFAVSVERRPAAAREPAVRLERHADDMADVGLALIVSLFPDAISDDPPGSVRFSVPIVPPVP